MSQAKAVIVCLECWHWQLSFQQTHITGRLQLDTFYCDDCKTHKKVRYTGLVNTVNPMVESKQTSKDK